VTPEDKRTAVGLSVGLSGQLISAALAMLALEGTYLAYALASREVLIGFEVVSVAAAAAFIWSVLVAGKAVTEARNAGFAGEWKLEAGKDKFNQQAQALVLGLALFVGVLLLSGENKVDKSPSADESRMQLTARVADLEAANKRALERLTRVEAELASSRTKPASMSSAPPLGNSAREQQRPAG
jgi:multisubunit Na+/H+ antiporter MnhC subunit